MKRIFLLSLILAFLLTKYGLNFSNEVLAESIISCSHNVDVLDEETKITVKLNTHINNNQRVYIEVPNTGQLKSEDNSIDLDIKLSTNYLYSGGQTATITIKHAPITNRGNYSFKLPLKVKLETYKEEKTVYSYQNVASWNYDDYSLSDPGGNTICVTQYGYKEVNDFSNENYSLEMPSDGFYSEGIQYGYEKRSKETKRVPHEEYRETHYNNIGTCPYNCLEWTVNNYGTGCSCTMYDYITTYSDETTYGEWALNEDSWCNEGPYQESDTIKPLERTIYYLPDSWGEETGWNFENAYEKTNSIMPLVRTVYLKPSGYTESSNWSFEEIHEDQNTIVHTKQVCRILENGNWSDWNDCN